MASAIKHEDGIYPPFQLNSPRFDQGTYFGRLRHFLDIIDPRTLFTSKQKLEESIQLLRDFEDGKVSPGTSNKELWEAQKVKQLPQMFREEEFYVLLQGFVYMLIFLAVIASAKEAIIHPDTGEKVFMPFRMSGFVPFGAPIVTGLLLPNPSLAQTVFWQWINQSHNACVNYANRNASKPTPTSRFILGYIGAVSSAVSIAVGLNVLISKASSFSPAKKMLIQRFVPFPAVAAASTCNILLMRYSELFEGIEVFNSDKQVIGTSKVAAKKALMETAVTRMVLPAPILLIPPAIMALLEKTKFLKTFPKAHLPVNALVCTLAFGGALPAAIALFPQISKVKTSTLEPELQSRTTEACLMYNKGL